MRRLAGAVLVCSGIVAGSASARADQFTLDAVTLAVNQSDPGLVLWARSLIESPLSFTLNTVGQQYWTPLFEVGTNETSYDPDDQEPRRIDVGLLFSLPPELAGSTHGISGAAMFSPLGAQGYVGGWQNGNALYLEYGNTGVLRVQLQGVLFDLPGSATVGARFTLMQADTPGAPTTVPEPGAGLLLVVGVAAVAVARRRQRACQA